MMSGGGTKLVEFIKRYGSELFTQRFFSLGNVRAILHQGVGDWLQSFGRGRGLRTEACSRNWMTRSPARDAEEHLSLILEAIVENYGEYRDYNSTTTQSIVAKCSICCSISSGFVRNTTASVGI